MELTFNKEIELDTFNEPEEGDNEDEEDEEEQAADEGELDEEGQQDTEQPHHMVITLTPSRRKVSFVFRIKKKKCWYFSFFCFPDR